MLQKCMKHGLGVLDLRTSNRPKSCPGISYSVFGEICTACISVASCMITYAPCYPASSIVDSVALLAVALGAAGQLQRAAGQLHHTERPWERSWHISANQKPDRRQCIDHQLVEDLQSHEHHTAPPEMQERSLAETVARKERHQVLAAQVQIAAAVVVAASETQPAAAAADMHQT